MLPSFRLVGPYAMPASQQPKRRAAPAGQQKWTQKQISRALKEIAAGHKPAVGRRIIRVCAAVSEWGGHRPWGRDPVPEGGFLSQWMTGGKSA